jgi:hypothetical protein
MARLWATACIERGAAVSPLLLACGMSLAACALDVRTLSSGEGGSSGVGAEGGTMSFGNRSGSGSAPPVDVPVCSYPTADPGCSSIIDNAGFLDGIEPWRAEPLAIAARWSQDDANGARDSGSITVVNTMHGSNVGIAPGAAMQCLPAAPGEVFGMAADIFIPEGQGDGLEATDKLPGPPFLSQAGLGLLFWPTADCSATAATQGSFQTNLVEEAGVWHHVEGSAVAPLTAGSVSVRTLTVKPFRQFAFEARFDNVLLQRK